MNKNNTPALYSEAFGDAHELTDAELLQVQGAGGNHYNAHNLHHNDHRSDCGDRGGQRFRQGNYGWSFQGDGNNRWFQGDCDDRGYRPNCYSQGFQGEYTHGHNC